MDHSIAVYHRVLTYVLALLLGIVGMALYLAGYHLYLDHRFVDDVRQQIVNQQQQSQQPQAPQPPRK